MREVYPHTGKARIVGFTGPPGVGKSTLIGALVAHALRKDDRQVAVLSIDPSSPFTEGALLGDRIRLSEHFLDEGVFIRSMASRGALGGLSEATLQAVLLMDASGKDDVLVETVGVGQAEIDIVDHADTIVLVLMPGSGDSVQALKAGVMEIPDVIVVNKADHPLTDTMVREIRGVLALGPATDWKVPILKTEAAEGEGVEELAEAIDAHRAHIEAAGTLEERRGAQPAQRGARARGRADAAASWSARCADDSPCRSCSTASSSGSSIPPARPRSCCERERWLIPRSRSGREGRAITPEPRRGGRLRTAKRGSTAWSSKTCRAAIAGDPALDAEDGEAALGADPAWDRSPRLHGDPLRARRRGAPAASGRPTSAIRVRDERRRASGPTRVP